MTQLEKLAAGILSVVVLIVGVILGSRPEHDPVNSTEVVVIDSGIANSIPSQNTSLLQPTKGGVVSPAQDDAFANSFTPPATSEQFDWADSSSATQGFSDRTGPPTLASGGFNASPDEKPLNGEALDIP